ncbi:metallopeptidase family protein [Demequina sp. NBRC 110054]|uniref:metallopeptidase family protein n=1 Tax=Demequina sp. NBRC 110054 TaxID=1570343 RepID=UPI000A0272FA|nr:metallopeptidase family protein [Demequina sp. NBRC 110054]
MARRDRHGRGLRAPVIPASLPGHRSRGERFDALVVEAAERLEPRWGSRWGRVEFGVEDVPPSDPSPWEEGVPLGRLFPEDMGQPARVVVYRRPCEERAEGTELPLLVRDVVAEQLAHLLGCAPEDVDPDFGG